ncbi:phasin family protein [Trichloromonas acetexigens]|jgi:polyhydroxyalkanoate synthesis regulator phasin|uniref:Phasin superfamily protein n=1 Tax=Trichloromonas acetexigens TaxID=38815 RepID=A0A550JDH1_9BACT|nr:phasin family protein [Desulfuromonas acetexigens]TRO81246.1 phasin superfamily protein [Desulfuromonas acetexigens]
MFELIEKTLLAGMGAVSLSQKKGEELIQDLKQRFNVTEEEGKALLDKLQGAAKDTQKKLEEMALQEVKKACERIGVATGEEHAALKQRVKDLEEKLRAQGE